MTPFELIVVALAAARITYFITDDAEAFQEWLTGKWAEAPDNSSALWWWQFTRNGFTCAYCVGFWVSLALVGWTAAWGQWLLYPWTAALGPILWAQWENKSPIVPGADPPA